MNKYLEVPKLSDYECVGAYLRDINDLVAKQNDEIIEKILLNMGVTKDFMIAHKDDFLIMETGVVKYFMYKGILLFTQEANMGDSNFVYEYKIHQKGKVV